MVKPREFAPFATLFPGVKIATLEQLPPEMPCVSRFDLDDSELDLGNFITTTVSDQTSVLTAETLRDAYAMLSDERRSLPLSFFIAPETYRRLRWLDRLIRLYPPRRRKLRTCQMRRITRRLRVERRRYL